MKIYIPTIGRHDKQRTAEMCRSAEVDYTLVLSPNDRSTYLHPKLFADTHDIRETRQWILDHAQGKLVMMDDDLRFYTRRREKTFDPATPYDFKAMVAKLEEMLERYAHGGVNEKFMSHTTPRGYKRNSKYYHILAYNKDLFPRPHPRFQLKIGEDHDMNLQLLTAGKANFVLTEWANDDKEGAPGGCNTWRTVEMEHEEAKELELRYPDFVRAKGKRVYVRWKEAAKLGGC